MGYKHTDKHGNETKLKDLGLSHLKNIIRYVERKSKEGLVVMYGGGGVDIDSLWYDEETFYGKEAKEKLNYKKYTKELKRRSE